MESKRFQEPDLPQWQGEFKNDYIGKRFEGQ